MAGHPDHWRKMYAKDPAKWKAKAQRWKRENPQKATESEMRRRARMRNAERVERIDPLYVHDRDGGICHICGKGVALAEMTLDHLVPLSKGGNHTHDNVCVAHLSCNSSRGAGRLPAQLLLIG